MVRNWVFGMAVALGAAVGATEGAFAQQDKEKVYVWYTDTNTGNKVPVDYFTYDAGGWVKAVQRANEVRRNRDRREVLGIGKVWLGDKDGNEVGPPPGANDAGGTPKPTPKPRQEPAGLNGTRWRGSENPGGGSHGVEFQFGPGRQVTAYDPKGEWTGTYAISADGKRISVHLEQPGEVFYEGTINGANMRGTARDSGGKWNWSVSRR